MASNQQIREFMDAMHITKADMARILNMAHTSVSRIYELENSPNSSVIEQMAVQYPKLNIRWLVTGEGGMWDLARDVDPDKFEEPQEPYSRQPTIREYQMKIEALEDMIEQLRDQLRDKERIIALYENSSSEPPEEE